MGKWVSAKDLLSIFYRSMMPIDEIVRTWGQCAVSGLSGKTTPSPALANDCLSGHGLTIREEK